MDSINLTGFMIYLQTYWEFQDLIWIASSRRFQDFHGLFETFKAGVRGREQVVFPASATREALLEVKKALGELVALDRAVWADIITACGLPGEFPALIACQGMLSSAKLPLASCQVM